MLRLASSDVDDCWEHVGEVAAAPGVNRDPTYPR